MKNLKYYFRSIQTNFPFLQDYRFTARRILRGIKKTPHEEDFKALPQLPLGQDCLCLDIGANRGEAIQSIRLFYNNCRIVAFEPNPVIFSKIKRLYRDQDGIEIHNVGLGDEEGEFDLCIPFYKNFMFDGLASFDYEYAADWLRRRMYNFVERHLIIKKFTCPVKKLDDYNLAPDLIKIDVQNYEYQVLKGGITTINNYRPFMLIESPDDNVTEFLETRGYLKIFYNGKKFLRGRGSLNTFFVPEEKVQNIKLQEEVSSL